jgi:hypothetical protein
MNNCIYVQLFYAKTFFIPRTGLHSGDVPVRPMQPIKGRGAASQITHRFARELRQGFDDGWASPNRTKEAKRVRRSDLVHPSGVGAGKSALSRHESPDLPFIWG